MKKVLLALILICRFYFCQGQYFSSINDIDNNVSGGHSYPIDLDNDGDNDVVCVLNGEIVWYENMNGLGTSWEKKSINNEFTSIPYSSCLNFNDFNGDGFIDIVFSSNLPWEGENLLLHQDGQGTFQPMINLGEGGNQRLASGDIDGDNDMDILMGTVNSSVIKWMENTNGQGVFENINYPNTGFSDPISQIFLEDFNGDGTLDLLVETLFNIYLFFNEDGQGNFSNQIFINDGAFTVSKTTPIDMDNDGDMDIVTLSNSDIVWYENSDGNGTFSNPQTLLSTSGGIGIRAIFIFDLDNDNDIDIVLARHDPSNQVLRLYKNNGTLDFSEKMDLMDLPFNPFSNDWSNQLLADFNGDGFIDIVSSANVGLFWLSNLSNSVSADRLPEYMIQIYPNPTTKRIFIKNIDSVKIEELRVIASNGQTVPFRKPNSLSGEIELEFDRIVSGNYFLLLKIDGAHYFHQFVIQ